MTRVEEEVETVPQDQHSQQGDEDEAPLWVEGDPIVDSNAIRIGADGDRYLAAEVGIKNVEADVCSGNTQPWQD